MTQKPLSYRPEIDVLRAWAVIIVVLYHLDIPSFSGGFVGVDVFFVISGYLITRNIRVPLEKDTFSLSRFYAQRARRLMPSLLVTLIITLILGFYLMASSHFLALVKNAFGAVLSLSNIFFWKQTNYFDDALKLNPMMHTWSLSLEEQFYLLYPLLLIWLTKKSKNRKSLTWSLSIASLVSLMISIWATKHHSAFAFYMVPTRLWEFSIGGLVWCLEDLRVKKDKTHSPNVLQNPSIKSNLSMALHALSFMIILYSCARLDEHDQFPGLLALLPCLAASLFIYIPPVNHFLTPLYLHRTWVKLGQMSYAIYLVHWPIITFYRHYHFDIKLSLNSQIQIILLTLISAYGLHVLIEQPLRKNIRLIPVIITVVLCLTSSFFYLWKTPQATVNAKSQQILVTHGLNQDLALKDFKRSTYGGQGCKPPRCSTQTSSSKTSLVTPNQEQENQRIDAFVIGDSYALALFQGIKKHFPQRNIIFWERGACEFYSLSYVQ
jgi:peptidoglycan/LPS O-acetylase OafA/YrhL